MKYLITGKEPGRLPDLLAGCGCTPAAPGESPDIVIAHGGDGSLLQACRQYRDLPILAIRDTIHSRLCGKHTQEELLKRFVSGEMNPRRMPLVSGKVRETVLYGLNDVFVHNSQRGNALRYSVKISGKPYAYGVIGDAVGLSSVHGATAYYRSITRSIFRVGLGLAFSNSTELVNHLVVPEDSVIAVEILRGPGVLIADNAAESVPVDSGETVILRQSDKSVLLYGLEEFMCPICRELRHPRPLEL